MNFFFEQGETTSAEVPEILVGILAVAAALMILPFPETAQKPLPNTKEDVRNLNSPEINHNLIA